MKTRKRNIGVLLYLNQDEYDLLNAKVRESKMPSRAHFLRHMILVNERKIYCLHESNLSAINPVK